MIHVLCFGNELHGDDGFGIHVGRAVAAQLDSDKARVFEVGARGLDALPLAEGCARLLLVDALHDAAQVPGTLCEIELRDVPEADAGQLHAAGVAWLATATRAGVVVLPDATLLGAVVGAIRPFDMALSPPLAARVPEVAARVIELVTGGGRDAQC